MLLFIGCSSKEVNVYNKPALYWYQHIVSSIANDNLDKADNYYSSLQGEHIGSPLLREATLILAIAHLKNEEYLLSTHFLNEYIKRYANPNEKEYCEYLKVKATYLSLPRPRRDQDLLNQAIEAAKTFESRYPTSQYYDIVDTMLTRMYISRSLFDRDIARLYKRIDKPLGAKYYDKVYPQKWVDWSLVESGDIPWYREWFVGNGKGSWYGFMIPDTINVVARDSYKQEENLTKK
jgi:outer membrane protein assembly factor BamD